MPGSPPLSLTGYKVPDTLETEMKYGVKNCNDGVIAESTKTDNFEEARSTAISLSNWNIECDIVDLETGEALKHFTPYKDLFAGKV
jgi:hypothetical protein